MIRTCLYCGKEFEYEGNRNRKYCSRICRNRANFFKKESTLETCPICGKQFEKGAHNNKYCSLECREKGNYLTKKKWKDTTKGKLHDGGKDIRTCKQCGKEFEWTKCSGNRYLYCSDKCAKQWHYEQALKNVHNAADRRCVEWLQNGVPDNFTVLSDWTEGDGNVEIEIRCNDCGGTFKKQIYKVRAIKNCPLCHKRAYHYSPKYGSMDDYNAARKQKRQESIKQKEKEKESRKQIKICEICGVEFETYQSSRVCCSHECSEKYETEKRIRQKQQFEQEQLSIDRICKNCGTVFHCINVCQRYCSTECAKKMSKSRERAKRRLRIDENYIEDVSLEKLYERDGGICYLCGRKTNYNDYEIKDDVFIAGNWYPSIDHIVPLCEGGEHSYKNTKLAHRICNSLRYVKEKKAQ